MQLHNDIAAIIEAARGAVWLLDAAGVVYYASPTAAFLVELAPEDMVGRPWSEVVAAAGLGCADWVPAGIPPGRWDLPLHGQTTLRTRSGVPRHVQLGLSHLPRGAETHVLVGMGDVTELAETVRALRASEERYRVLVETMGDGLAIVDSDLRLTFVNGAFARMLGYGEAELLGGSVLSLCDEADAAVVSEQTARGLASRAETEYEISYRTRAGETVPVLVKATPLPDGSGQVTAVLTVVRDISGRKRAERRLAESELLFRSVFAESPVAIALYDREGRLTTANDAALGMGGVDGVEAIRGVSLLDHPAMTEEARQRLLQGEVVRGEITVDPPQLAATRWLGTARSQRMILSVVVAPLRLDDHSTVSGYVAHAEDVTQRRRDEEAQRMATVGQLASGVAHEFNNLLASMMMRAEFALETGDVGEFRKLAGLVVRAAARGADICAGLSAFARPAALCATLLCLDSVIAAALDQNASEMARWGVRVEQSLSTADRAIVGDAAQLALVCSHLITNACHAMRQGGVLTVRSEPGTAADGAEQVVVQFSDTGEGIAPEYLPLVFEPFFTTKGRLGESDLPGTGLGLSVVHGIVSSHGGTIAALSEPGKGATFELRFPVGRAMGSRPDGATTGTEGAPAAYHVLVVDDDDDLGDAIAESLRRRGHSAVVAYTPQQAVAALAREGFDLIITDLVMPGGGGAEVVAAARTLAKPPPVLMITGKTQTAAAEMLADVAVERLMFKPFTIAELLDACYELVGEEDRQRQ